MPSKWKSRVPSYEEDQRALEEAERKRLDDMSWWERAVNGAKTGYNEGSIGGPWGAIGGAAGGAIDGAVNGGVYKAHVKNGDTVAQGGGQGLGGGSSFGGGYGGGLSASRSAFGYVPEPAEYERVPLDKQDFGAIQRQTIQDNISMGDMIAQLLYSNGRTNQQLSLNRANGFDPALWNNVGAASQVASQYLAGQPSWSDAMEIVARSTGLTGSNGTPGSGANLTARDLGLFDMDLRRTGADMNMNAARQADLLDPRSNYGKASDYQLTPAQTVPWKIDENLNLSALAIKQNENQFAADQNANNLAAAPDPMAAGLYAGNLALSLAETRSQGSQGGGGGLDWGSIISGLASAYGQSTAGKGGTA